MRKLLEHASDLISMRYYVTTIPESPVKNLTKNPDFPVLVSRVMNAAPSLPSSRVLRTGILWGRMGKLVCNFEAMEFAWGHPQAIKHR